MQLSDFVYTVLHIPAGWLEVRSDPFSLSEHPHTCSWPASLSAADWSTPPADCSATPPPLPAVPVTTGAPSSWHSGCLGDERGTRPTACSCLAGGPVRVCVRQSVSLWACSVRRHVPAVCVSVWVCVCVCVSVCVEYMKPEKHYTDLQDFVLNTCYIKAWKWCLAKCNSLLLVCIWIVWLLGQCLLVLPVLARKNTTQH